MVLTQWTEDVRACVCVRVGVCLRGCVHLRRFVSELRESFLCSRIQIRKSSAGSRVAEKRIKTNPVSSFFLASVRMCVCVCV